MSRLDETHHDRGHSDREDGVAGKLTADLEPGQDKEGHVQGKVHHFSWDGKWHVAAGHGVDDLREASDPGRIDVAGMPEEVQGYGNHD